MIHTIVFSKNRAAQLDQLLQSIDRRAAGTLNPIDVLWTATSWDYMRGYHTCQKQFPNVKFTHEHSFQQQLTETLHRSPHDHIAFLCDDDLVTRPFTDNPSPAFLLSNKQILAVSLRLGTNTTNCYPLNRPQHTPPFLFAIRDAKIWNWRGADGDWGYPGSLDGHVFRRSTILDLLATSTYTGPNRLEETLAHQLEHSNHPNLMACYKRNVITGCPLNLVNTTHTRNRNAGQNPAALNNLYLEGKRPMLYPIEPGLVTAAHTELPLVFA